MCQAKLLHLLFYEEVKSKCPSVYKEHGGGAGILTQFSACLVCALNHHSEGHSVCPVNMSVSALNFSVFEHRTVSFPLLYPQA